MGPAGPAGAASGGAGADAASGGAASGAAAGGAKRRRFHPFSNVEEDGGGDDDECTGPVIRCPDCRRIARAGTVCYGCNVSRTPTTKARSSSARKSGKSASAASTRTSGPRTPRSRQSLGARVCLPRGGSRYNVPCTSAAKKARSSSMRKICTGVGGGTMSASTSVAPHSAARPGRMHTRGRSPRGMRPSPMTFIPSRPASKVLPSAASGGATPAIPFSISHRLGRSPPNLVLLLAARWPVWLLATRF